MSCRGVLLPSALVTETPCGYIALDGVVPEARLLRIMPPRPRPTVKPLVLLDCSSVKCMLTIPKSVSSDSDYERVPSGSNRQRDRET